MLSNRIATGHINGANQIQVADLRVTLLARSLVQLVTSDSGRTVLVTIQSGVVVITLLMHTKLGILRFCARLVVTVLIR